MEAIEKNLKDICRAKGLTVTDVANRMGADPSNLLSSIKGNPKLSTLQDISNALQVSVSELLTRRPDKAQGIAIIGGQVYQVSKPAASIVQLPVYERYSDLRDDIKEFVSKAIEAAENSSIMGLVETFEVFSLAFDHQKAFFLLSLCYADGKTLTISYDKLEFCSWKDEDTEDTVKWDNRAITEEIINDIESAVPSKLERQ